MPDAPPEPPGVPPVPAGPPPVPEAPPVAPVPEAPPVPPAPCPHALAHVLVSFVRHMHCWMQLPHSLHAGATQVPHAAEHCSPCPLSQRHFSKQLVGASHPPGAAPTPLKKPGSPPEALQPACAATPAIDKPSRRSVRQSPLRARAVATTDASRKINLASYRIAELGAPSHTHSRPQRVRPGPLRRAYSHSKDAGKPRPSETRGRFESSPKLDSNCFRINELVSV